MKRAFTDIPEGQIHYRTEGSGFPLLLLHQCVQSSNEFSGMIPILSKHYWVLAMDYLGYGDSDPAPSVYTMADHAQSVVSFLDSLGIEKAIVVGQHTGACIAVEIAADYPERVDKLVLSGLLQPVSPEEPVPSFMVPMEIKEDGSHLLRCWEIAKSFGPRAPIEMHYQITVDYLKAGPRGEEAHQAAWYYNCLPKLPLIKCPTLAFDGRYDMYVPFLEEIQKLVPRCRTLVIEGPGTGPAITLRRPEAFAEAVLDFSQNPNV